MNGLIAGFMPFIAQQIRQEKEMCAEFTRRKEEARKKYWDACEYPRKTKKRMRKEARTDFDLYSILEQPMFAW